MNVKKVINVVFSFTITSLLGSYSLSARDQLTFPSSGFDQFNVKQSPLSTPKRDLAKQLIATDDDTTQGDTAKATQKDVPAEKTEKNLKEQKNIYLNF